MTHYGQGVESEGDLDQNTGDLLLGRDGGACSDQSDKQLEAFFG